VEQVQYQINQVKQACLKESTGTCSCFILNGSLGFGSHTSKLALLFFYTCTQALGNREKFGSK